MAAAMKLVSTLAILILLSTTVNLVVSIISMREDPRIPELSSQVAGLSEEWTDLNDTIYDLIDVQLEQIRSIRDNEKVVRTRSFHVTTTDESTIATREFGLDTDEDRRRFFSLLSRMGNASEDEIPQLLRELMTLDAKPASDSAGPDEQYEFVTNEDWKQCLVVIANIQEATDDEMHQLQRELLRLIRKVVRVDRAADVEDSSPGTGGGELPD